jgi:hypothetical protein
MTEKKKKELDHFYMPYLTEKDKNSIMRNYHNGSFSKSKESFEKLEKLALERLNLTASQIPLERIQQFEEIDENYEGLKKLLESLKNQKKLKKNEVK